MEIKFKTDTQLLQTAVITRFYFYFTFYLKYFVKIACDYKISYIFAQELRKWFTRQTLKNRNYEKF